jgi:hypothetical protein
MIDKKKAEMRLKLQRKKAQENTMKMGDENGKDSFIGKKRMRETEKYQETNEDLKEPQDIDAGVDEALQRYGIDEQA